MRDVPLLGILVRGGPWREILHHLEPALQNNQCLTGGTGDIHFLPSASDSGRHQLGQLPGAVLARVPFLDGHSRVDA